MPGTSLFLLIDDIVSVLDDVAAMTKMAVNKTAGVLGDDLALNAQQVAGVKADRELAVVWAVAKGSAVNKLILIPAALVISAIMPVLIKPLLMVGGAYLCYEGVEKFVHKFFHPHQAVISNHETPPLDSHEGETHKIAGAIRTDFILSAEIIVISLGTVAQSSLGTQLAVLLAIGVIMTVGVYGLVAGIIKLDDLGLYLHSRSNPLLAKVGRLILAGTPYLLKALSWAGTMAMFLVGGGILTHNLPPVYNTIHSLTHRIESSAGAVMASGVSMVLDGLFGIVAGIIVLLAVMAGQRLLKKTVKPTV
jgi:uncharacterized protein